jgi:diphthamide synthase (EF-2-diphthine--ammonia ligase)
MNANRAIAAGAAETRTMPAPAKAMIAWSSGKDSAWALHEARKSRAYDIVGALTTVTDSFARVSMHGVREELLTEQLAVAALEPIIVRIPYPCPNEIYEREMAAALAAAKARGVTHMIFGDLFLEDIRAYREKQLAGTGITPVFPLWLKPTAALALEMIDAGVEAHLAVVDLKKLPMVFAGRRFDAALLDALPAHADPCGENGEFHSFVSAGPMLARKISISVGETVERDGFAFADLVAG